MIELDNIDTWGENIKKLLSELNKKEEEFDEKWKKKTVPEKVSKDGVNTIEKYMQEKKQIEGQIEENLNKRKIVCYHCTRLTRDDYKSIKKNGLIVLTKKSQIDRIKKIGLNKEEEDQIIKTLKMKDLFNREGQIHFVYSLKSIDFGCVPFFKHWGGESIYGNINEFETAKKKISSISKPYVIKFAVKYSDICNDFFMENMKKKLKYEKINR